MSSQINQKNPSQASHIARELAEDIEQGRIIPGIIKLIDNGLPNCALGHFFIRCGLSVDEMTPKESYRSLMARAIGTELHLRQFEENIAQIIRLNDGMKTGKHRHEQIGQAMRDLASRIEEEVNE